MLQRYVLIVGYLPLTWFLVLLNSTLVVTKMLHHHELAVCLRLMLSQTESGLMECGHR